MGSLAILTIVLKLVDIVAAGMSAYPGFKARYDNYRAKVQVFIDEGRAPTEEEFEALIAESDDLTAQIEAVAATKTV